MNTPSHHARIDEQLEEYWQQLRGDRALPREDEIDPASIKDIWSACFLVTSRFDGTFAYTYLGDALVEAYGDDLTGREIADTLLGAHPKSLLGSFEKAVRDGMPVTDEGEFVNSKGIPIKYRSCVLPLAGTHGEGVGFLLGGMKWKAY
jgi:hypothetical protein